MRDNVSWLLSWLGSFREVGAAILSVAVIVLTAVVLWNTVDLVSKPPQTYAVGTETLTYSPFDRAKDILNIVIPLFSAVLAYWLGVKSEGDRNNTLQRALEDCRARDRRSDRILEAILSVDGQVLGRARQQYSEAFAE